MSLPNWLEKRFYFQNQFGCWDKRINLGKAYNSEEMAAFAIHIEVAADQFGTTLKKLAVLVLLKAKQQGMPLMIWMRVVPNLCTL